MTAPLIDPSSEPPRTPRSGELSQAMNGAAARPDDGLLTPTLIAWRRRTDAPLLVLAIGSLPMLLLDLKRGSLTHHDRVFLDIVNIAVLVAFATDYAVEFAVTRNRRVYVRREWTSALIAIAQALALAPALAGFGALRILRAGRIWRAIAVVGRVFAVGGAAAREGKSILRRHAAAFALGMAGFTWITSAVGFTLAEDVGVNGRIHSFGDAIWWSSATITTVGHGDVAPVTVVGRLVGVVTMVVGISTFAVLTAKIAEFLVRTDRSDSAQANDDRSQFNGAADARDGIAGDPDLA